MIDSIQITKLDKGYLVTREGDRPVAGLSTAPDLCEWIALWTGEDVDVIGFRERSAETDGVPGSREELPDVDLKELLGEHRPEAGPALTRKQQAVLQHIERCAAKLGREFRIGLTTLAERSGIKESTATYYLGKLKEAGLIDFKPPYGGDVVITLTHSDGGDHERHPESD